MSLSLPAGYRSREWLVFATATLVALAHALDDAVLHRQPGVGPGQHALAAAIAACLALAATAAFPYLRPGLRAGLAFGFGSLALVNGGLHVLHIAADGPAGSDVSGALAAGAGAALLALAAAIPWRHRGAGGRRRRWAGRALAAPLALLGLVLVVVPVGTAIVDTHKHRASVGAAPDAA